MSQLPHSKIAVLGSGAREHALAVRLAEELGEEHVLVTPGGECIPGSFSCAEADLVSELLARAVTLVVVGPEALLARGIADRLRAAGIAVLGPGEDDARLETSKAYAKDFMARYRVARARSETVRGVSVARRMGHVAIATHGGIVVKFDGLAAGKGSFVCTEPAQLDAALATIEASWGAGAELILEDYLQGRELSLIAFVAGGQARLFPPVEDHKQLHDGDRGPMTGGMGASYPAAIDSTELRDRLVREIVEPTLRGLRADHPDYRGILYFGLMVTSEGPKLLEYNVRFGDPETQILSVGMGESLAGACLETASGQVQPGWIAMREAAAVGVVLASPGYPESPALGVELEMPRGTNVQVFCAGVSRAGVALRATGGRVLSVVATGTTLTAARATAYAAIDAEAGLHYRRDIGARP